MNRTRLTLIAIFLVALGLRSIVLYERSSGPGFAVPIVDAGAYDQMARQLLAGEGVEPRMFWQPIFYPLFLASVYGLSGGSILAVKILQAILGAITCCLTFVLARKLFDQRVGLLAAGLTACYGPLILFEGELLAAGWAAFWSIALVLLFTLAAQRLQPASGSDSRNTAGFGAATALGLGAVSALAVLARPSFLPFVGIVWLWLLWRLWRQPKLDVEQDAREARRRLAIAAAAGLAGFMMITLPVAFASERVTGHFGFLPGSGGLNSYIGNNPESCETLSVRPGDAWGELIELPARHGIDGYAERNRFFYGRVVQYLRQQPLDFLSGMAEKALRFANSRELPRNIDVYFARGESKLLAALSWKAGLFGFPYGLIFPFAILGLVREWRRLGSPLLLFLTLYPLAIILVFVTARYRVPIIPVLAIPAAVGLLGFAKACAERGRQLAVAAATLAAGLLLTTLPGPFCEEALNMEADFFYCLAFAQAERGDPAGAITHYQRALESDPDLEQVHYNLGLLYADSDDVESAASHYREAVRLDPEFARAHNNLGSVIQDQGLVEEAIGHYTAAIRTDPELLPAQRNLAKALLSAGRSQEALTQIDLLAELEPNNNDLSFLRGGAYLQLGDLSRAAAAFRENLAKQPGNAQVHNDLGTALIGMQDFPGAIEQFEKALEISPDYLQAYNNAGATLAMAGDLQGARKKFEEAVRRAPEYVDARYNLATILLRLGETAAAVQELRQVLRIQPDHPRAGQRLQAIMEEVQTTG